MENLSHLKETIANALHTCENYEEWAGKFFTLLKTFQPSHEICQMIINGFIDSRLNGDYYLRFAAWLGSTNEVFRTIFAEMFKNLYESSRVPDLHRLYAETKFFARLIYKDSIPWNVLSYIQLKPGLSSFQQYFVTLILVELSVNFGREAFCERLKESKLRDDFKGLFPKDNLDNTRYAIKMFELVDLYDLTHDLHACITQEELNQQVQKMSL